MQIVDKTYFDKGNFLHIPLAVNEPSGLNVTNSFELDSLCIDVEKEILLNALGYELYTEMFALTDITIEDSENERWKKLIQGDELWIGLDNDNSLIAYRIFEQFTTETNIRLSATGATKVNAENATNQTPAYLITTANNRFIKQYQGGYLIDPIVIGNFTDWMGCNQGIEKSLYGYLVEKKVDFPEWDLSKFRVYETKNTFGI